MKKNNATIYTLNGYSNYGNRLQLFAISKILKELGFHVYVFWPKTNSEKIKMLLKYYTPLCIRSIKEKKLQLFTRKRIHCRTNNGKNELTIVGSDQVWNPTYLNKRPFLLEPNSSRIFSYAASIGTCTLTEEQRKMFRHALKKYSAISVREQSAKEILQPLTDKKVEVVIDPTLLLDESIYAAIEKKPKHLFNKKKYILCYFLGNRNYEAIIKQYADANNYEMIFFSDKRDSSYGVEEFLYLIHHAKLICTDSFHASVFSFIFDRPFIVFKRYGEENYMYTRLQNLLQTFRLEDREFNGKYITEENLKVDYAKAKKILKKEQEKSIDFLKRALDIKDEK